MQESGILGVQYLCGSTVFLCPELLGFLLCLWIVRFYFQREFRQKNIRQVVIMKVKNDRILTEVGMKMILWCTVQIKLRIQHCGQKIISGGKIGGLGNELKGFVFLYWLNWVGSSWYKSISFVRFQKKFISS